MEEIINKVFNEDCLVGMNRIPDKSIDCIICDLPYGTTDCKWDSVIPFEPLWKQYKRVRKDNCPIILFGSEPFSSYLRMSNIKEFRYDWIWQKNVPGNFQLAKKNPLKLHEIISVFYKAFPTYHNTELTKVKYHHSNKNLSAETAVKQWAEKSWTTEIGNYNRSILYFRNKEESVKKYMHPTQKPVDLIRYLIRTYTNSGDIVLDNCMGSGTTAIAALREGRKYIGFELDKKYYEMIQQRIAEEKDYIELTDNKLF